jgi:hypothetical protein
VALPFTLIKKYFQGKRRRIIETQIFHHPKIQSKNQSNNFFNKKIKLQVISCSKCWFFESVEEKKKPEPWIL